MGGGLNPDGRGGRIAHMGGGDAGGAIISDGEGRRNLQVEEDQAVNLFPPNIVHAVELWLPVPVSQWPDSLFVYYNKVRPASTWGGERQVGGERELGGQDGEDRKWTLKTKGM